MIQRPASYAGLLLLLAPLSSLAAAQRESPFSETVNVNVVTIDVFASTKQGSPMTGLQQTDFQLFEDDKKVKISGFSAAGTAQQQPPFDSIVLYVDDTHVGAASRDRVLDVLAPHLAARISNDGAAVMVVRYSGLSEVVQEFTSDAEAVSQAIETLKSYEPTMAESTILERSLGDTLRQGGTGNPSDAIFRATRGYGEAVHRDTEQSLASLTDLAASLGSRPGRKALYLVVDGLAMRPMGLLMTRLQRRATRTEGGSEYAGGQDASEGAQMRTALDGSGNAGGGATEFGVSKLQQDAQPLQTTESFQLLAAVANSAQTTIYPIRPPVLDASKAGLGNQTADRTRGLTDLREGPERLAEATAGQAFVSGSDVGAFLARTEEGGAAVYSIGFSPKDHPDGSFHTLKLKSKTKGLRLRYRQSYVAKTPTSLLTDRAVAAVTLGWVDNPHGIETEVAKQTQAEDGSYQVEVLVTIPIGELGMTEESGVHRADCRVALLVVTSDGRLTRPQILDVPLQIADAQIEDARKQLFGARASLRLAPGTQSLAVGLWDEVAKKGSYIAQQIEVGDG